ncbi:MAG: NAD(P)H-dependent oxidoreductase [Candidatus Bathyarchaeota archaeon]|nr:MAG: NAD(P)H-dependent oxidoreductase [Candidatus Bathyarchaeota archaeon]
MRILVIYDSKTGNTKKMALTVAAGARETKDAEVLVKEADKTTNENLLRADGIIVGSPTYYGQMSTKIKAMFDESVTIHGKLEGKVGAAFTSSGGVATGAETTIISILEAMLVHGMIIQGRASSAHYGVAAVGEPKEREVKRCRELGRMVADLILKLKASE